MCAGLNPRRTSVRHAAFKAINGQDQDNGAWTYAMCQTCVMSENSPVGSWVIAIWYRKLSWAVTAIVRTLSFDQISKLKVWSGEHLATILITSFLGVAPKNVDTAGETDLMFEIPRALPGDDLGRRLGLGNEPCGHLLILWCGQPNFRHGRT